MLTIQISIGEFLDKLTILEIKAARISDPAKLVNIQRELELLRSAWARCGLDESRCSEIVGRLKQTNESLWDRETEIRNKQAAKSFDAEFVELARSICALNDRRSTLKRDLNVMFDSELIEEKSYAPYP